MPIKVTCPKCQGVLHAPDDAGGKRGKCPTCGTVLSIPAEGPRVSAPTGASDPAFRPPPQVPDDLRQSSFGSRPPEPETRKAPPPPPARIPPPPAARTEPRKLSDPFTKPGPGLGLPVDATAKAWRRTRRGLGTVQFALFLFLLALVALPALAIAQHYGVTLPSQNPGYLGQQDLTSDQEIRVGAVVVPLVLGLIFLALGRMGAANAPRSSYARGPAVLAGIASLLILVAGLAMAVPSIGQIMAGSMPIVYQQGRLDFILLPWGDMNGIAQRSGLAVLVLLIPLAEVWFVSALGRMGSGLQSARASGRHTRFILIFGVLFALLGVYGVATVADPEGLRWLRIQTDRLLTNSLGQLGNDRPVAENGLVILAALFGWFLYARLVGGVRRAIREWLDDNAPV